jgi:putative chitinase
MTPELLQVCTGSTLADAEKYAEPITDAMQRFGITTVRQRAAFLATVAIESEHLRKTEESLYYRDPVRLAAIYPRVFKNAADAAPYTRNPDALGELLYQGYWGRGFLGLTWLRNYTAASDALGYDYIHHPELVREPLHAALTAGWFWDTNNCNAPADQADMRGVTRKVNGPALMHLSERMTQYVRAVSALTHDQ